MGDLANAARDLERAVMVLTNNLNRLAEIQTATMIDVRALRDRVAVLEMPEKRKRRKPDQSSTKE